MSCEQYRELFDSVFDKEIRDPSKQDLFRHLEVCADCSIQFKLYEKLIAGVENLEEAEPPSDLTAAIMQGVNASCPPPWEGQSAVPLPASWLWAGAFAVTFVLTATTFTGWDAQATRRTMLPPIPLPPAYRDEVPHLAADRQAAEPALERVPVPTEEPRVLLVRHGGHVEIAETGSDAFHVAKDEQTLKFGQLVKTGEDGVASLEYREEKVALRVRPGSLLQVLDPHTLRVFAGNTWVVVKRKGTVFRAQTPNAIASVRGTKFSVEVTPVAQGYQEAGVQALRKMAAPVVTTNLGAFQLQVGLSVAHTLARADSGSLVQSNVRVYESTVHVARRDAKGLESAGFDLGEGFKSRITLAAVEPPQALTDADLVPWRGVMVVDPSLLERARAKVAEWNRTPQTGPPINANPSAEPTSDSGFEDLHRH